MIQAALDPAKYLKFQPEMKSLCHDECFKQLFYHRLTHLAGDRVFKRIRFATKALLSEIKDKTTTAVALTKERLSKISYLVKKSLPTKEKVTYCPQFSRFVISLLLLVIITATK